MKKEFMNKLLTYIHNNIKHIDKLLEKTIINIVSEMDNKSCYIRDISSFTNNLMINLNISESDLKNAINEFKSNLKKDYGKILIFSDTKTFLMLLLIIYYTNIDDKKNSIRCIYILLVKHYSNLMRKSLPKGCDQTYFNTALEYLPKSHLFVRKNILNSLLDLAQQLYQKYFIYFKKQTFNYDKIILFIYEGRHRINQSLKTFINAYLKAYKNKSVSISDENNYILDKVQESDKEKIVNKVSDKLLIEDEINESSILIVNRITKINKNIIRLMIEKIRYIDNDVIKTIYLYLLNDIKDINSIKNRQFILTYTRKLMSVKITKKQVYYKKLIFELLNNILKLDNKLNTFYKNINNNSKYNLALSLALYLSDFLYQLFAIE